MSQCLFSDDTAVLVAGLGGICAVFVVFASCACLCSCCRSRQIWTTVAAAEAAHVRAGTGVLVAPPVSSYEQHETAVFYFCCGQERVQFFCPVLRMVVDACQVALAISIVVFSAARSSSSSAAESLFCGAMGVVAFDGFLNALRMFADKDSQYRRERIVSFVADLLLGAVYWLWYSAEIELAGPTACLWTEIATGCSAVVLSSILLVIKILARRRHVRRGPQNNNVFAANAVSGAGPTGLADSENVSCNTSSTPLLSSVGDDMGHEEKHSDVLAEVVGGETPDAPPRRRNIARVIATTTVLAVGGDAAEVGEADASAQVLDTARPHGVPMEAQLKVAMYDLLDHEDRAVLQFSGGESLWIWEHEDARFSDQWYHGWLNGTSGLVPKDFVA